MCMFAFISCQRDLRHVTHQLDQICIARILFQGLGSENTLQEIDMKKKITPNVSFLAGDWRYVPQQLGLICIVQGSSSKTQGQTSKY